MLLGNGAAEEGSELGNAAANGLWVGGGGAATELLWASDGSEGWRRCLHDDGCFGAEPTLTSWFDLGS